MATTMSYNPPPAKSSESIHPNLTHQMGEIVSVRAWWTFPGGQIIKCKIQVVRQPHVTWGRDWAGYYEVRPVDQPGAHLRMIRQGAIL